MKISKFYRQQAWNSLSSNYWNLLLITVIGGLLLSFISWFFPLSLIAGGFFSVAFFTAFVKNSRGEKVVVDDFFRGFFDRLEEKLASGCLVFIYTLLWSLLFIIPGIIKSYAYSMTFYLISIDSSLTASEAIDLSQKIMAGNKWRLFKLHFSFIGWVLLSVFTFGILSIFIAPYFYAANVEFFNDIYADYKESLNSPE